MFHVFYLENTPETVAEPPDGQRIVKEKKVQDGRLITI